ncbi:hypothetical protein [Streptomyces cyaneofuscatus]
MPSPLGQDGEPVERAPSGGAVVQVVRVVQVVQVVRVMQVVL